MGQLRGRKSAGIGRNGVKMEFFGVQSAEGPTRAGGVVGRMFGLCRGVELYNFEGRPGAIWLEYGLFGAFSGFLGGTPWYGEEHKVWCEMVRNVPI